MSFPDAKLVRQLPEPGRGWMVLTPRRWQSYDRLWLDLAQGVLQVGQLPAISPPGAFFGTDGLDELVYVPPVAIEYRQTRDELVAWIAESGMHPLVQVVLGDEAVPHASATVVDLTGPLLSDEMERLRGVPADAVTLWPLIAGISDQPEVIENGCARLLDAGARVVQPIAVEVAPPLRQQLAAGRPTEVFDALFRGVAPSEQDFVQRVWPLGLDVWIPRPETGASSRVRINRRVAGVLATIADLWLRLERPEAAGQALWRAARGAESCSYDLAALEREGNLEVLDWLDARAAEVVRAELAGEPTSLLGELRAAYVGAS